MAICARVMRPNGWDLTIQPTSRVFADVSWVCHRANFAGADAEVEGSGSLTSQLSGVRPSCADRATLSRPIRIPPTVNDEDAARPLKRKLGIRRLIASLTQRTLRSQFEHQQHNQASEHR